MTETTMTKITRITDEQLVDCADTLAQDLRDQLTYNFGELMWNSAVDALGKLGVTEDSFEDEEGFIDTVHDIMGSINITTF